MLGESFDEATFTHLVVQTTHLKASCAAAGYVEAENAIILTNKLYKLVKSLDRNKLLRKSS